MLAGVNVRLEDLVTVSVGFGHMISAALPRGYLCFAQ